MNIAYIVPSLAAKGPVIVARDICDMMLRNGHHCVVYYFDDISGVEFTCQTVKIGGDQLINFDQFDVVHSHGLRPDKYVATHMHKNGHTKYVSTVHNYAFEDFRYEYNWFVAQIFGRIWLRYLRKLDSVVCLSDHAVQYYCRWLKLSHLKYAYNTRSIDMNAVLGENELTDLLAFKGSSTLIGVNALLTKRKGIEQVISALVELPHHKLFVCGDGKFRDKLEKLAVRLGVADRVKFAGFVKDAYRYMVHYDLYLAPSRSEGFGLMLLEAAQYKVPTVCSKIAIFTEIFSDDEVAFFELDNIQSLVEAIKKATKNVAMGENMHRRYCECYTPENMYRRYLAIYHGEI